MWFLQLFASQSIEYDLSNCLCSRLLKYSIISVSKSLDEYDKGVKPYSQTAWISAPASTKARTIWNLTSALSEFKAKCSRGLTIWSYRIWIESDWNKFLKPINPSRSIRFPDWCQFPFLIKLVSRIVMQLNDMGEFQRLTERWWNVRWNRTSFRGYETQPV